MNGQNWTVWKDIGEECDYENAAVYKIALLESLDPLIPIAIPRFLREDKGGILLIGATGNMKRRRREFLNGQHGPASLWRRISTYTEFKKKFPNSMLAYCYTPMKDGEQATALEGTLILEYTVKYGEPPVLNSTIPKRYDDDEWQRLAQ